MNSNIRFEYWTREKMQDPEFRAAYEALEPVRQLARLRILRGLSQEQLADKVGTRQPSIARLESRKATPNLDFLRKVAAALDAQVEIRIVPIAARTPANP